MKSMALSMATATALWAALPASAQEDAATEPTPPSPAGAVCLDADGDGIMNRLDPDFEGGRMMGGGFLDADGDGINDMAQDADGDGVPNGRDADYVRPTGAGKRGMRGMGMRGVARGAVGGTPAQKR